MSHDAPPVVRWLATLSDTARLRLLRLLSRQELSVGELARALQLPQSTVSRHLKVLLEGGWVLKRTEGTASFYSVGGSSLDDAARTLWSLTLEQLDQPPGFEEDDRRLAEVLAERMTDSRAYFGRVGGEWDHVRTDLFGQAFTAESLLDTVDPSWVVADIGCGTGNAAELLAPLVQRVIAIDREPAMLEAARRRLAGHDNVSFHQGDLVRLPLENATIDLATVLLVLHHLEDPAPAIREIARVLRPGGRTLIVDMVAHGREAYRQTMGHMHLGFDVQDIRRWADTAGLRCIRHHRLRPDTNAKGPGLFVATLEK